MYDAPIGGTETDASCVSVYNWGGLIIVICAILFLPSFIYDFSNIVLRLFFCLNVAIKMSKKAYNLPALQGLWQTLPLDFDYCLIFNELNIVFPVFYWMRIVNNKTLGGFFFAKLRFIIINDITNLFSQFSICTI